jgi:DNA-binding transcriptional MocR family regulator
VKPYVWMRLVRDSDLPAATRLVAIMIGLRAAKNGSCYPSYLRIAEDTGMHRSTVIRHVSALVASGWLFAVPRCNGHGHQSNAYQLMDARRLWITAAENAPDIKKVVAQDDQVVAQDDPLGSRTGRPRRSIPKEEGKSSAADPVDNPALGAVISLLAHAHKIPS